MLSPSEIRQAICELEPSEYGTEYDEANVAMFRALGTDDEQAYQLAVDRMVEIEEAYFEANRGPIDDLLDVASTAFYSRDFAREEQAYKAALELHDSAPYRPPMLLGKLAECCANQGRITEALEYAKRASDAARKTDSEMIKCMSLGLEISFLIQAEKFEEASELIDEALGYCEDLDVGDVLINAKLFTKRAECKFHGGDRVEAQRDVDAAFEILKRFDGMYSQCGTQSALVRLSLLQAKLHDADKNFRAALKCRKTAVYIWRKSCDEAHPFDAREWRIWLADNLRELAVSQRACNQRWRAWRTERKADSLVRRYGSAN